MKEEETLQILKKINNFPNFSQRKLSKELGYSLGKLNYGLKNLAKKGLIKIKNLKEKEQANGKNYFKYLVTNKGKSLHDLSGQDLETDVELNNFNRKPTFLIAEIGINHNGSILDAKKLIKLAKKYDFDAVKFQKRDLNICIPENQKNILRETPWGLISYLDYKKKIELNLVQYKKLKDYADKIGIEMFASCWDVSSLRQIRKIKFKYNKIASAMITNLKFLNEVAKEKKKLLYQLGCAT